MKLLVFAHTPPPHHGQSYMVQLLLAGFGGDQRPARPPAPCGIACYHVNARLSQRLEDIGGFQCGKIFRLAGYCLQAIWIRYRHGVKNFYYIPAPGKRSAVYRDWMVMLLCRPFFSRMIFHWHAAGLAEWLEAGGQSHLRALTRTLLKNADLHLTLSEFNRRDAEYFSPRQIKVIANGIPDPCPDFARALAPRRHARLGARKKLAAGETLSDTERAQAGGDPQIIQVLFLALCTREKGLFDAIAGVLQANARLAAANSPLTLRLTVAGKFATTAENAEFQQILTNPAAAKAVHYAGFLEDAAKHRAFAEADVFCFPTYYSAESFGLVAVEAMAFGLPVVTTRWRSLPEMLPPGYPGLIAIQSPSEIAEALLTLAMAEAGQELRESFLQRFTLERHLTRLAAAMQTIDSGG